MSNWAVLLAAGLGVRMGTPKALLPLNGKPMLFYSIEAFEKSTRIDGIGIVCRKEEIFLVRSRAESTGAAKIGFVIPGGKERQDSVFEGIKALPREALVVAIHDCARPLITVELVDRVMETAKEHGGGVAAVRSKDTIKVSRNGLVKETLQRDLLWCAQTPQAFKVDLFQKALHKAKEEGFYGTDCATLVERIGGPVHLVEGSPENIKVTTPSDVRMAEALLINRIKHDARSK